MNMGIKINVVNNSIYLV